MMIVGAQRRTNFERKVAEKRGTILGEHKGTHEKIRIECIEGHIFETEPNSIKSKTVGVHFVVKILQSKLLKIKRQIS